MVRRWVFFLGAVVVLAFFVVAPPVRAQDKTVASNEYTGNGPTTSAARSNNPACNSSFDPYKVPRSFLKACGVKTYPLKAVNSLPGGGKAYIYYIQGIKTTFKVPPKGFNACKATDKQLAEYGLPPRPSGTSRKVDCYPQVVKPPPFIAEGGGSGTIGGTSSVAAGRGNFATTGALGGSPKTQAKASSSSQPARIPDTGGPLLLPYAAASLITFGVVMLLALRQRIR